MENLLITGEVIASPDTPKKSVFTNYTIIFKDTDNQLKEAWHFLPLENIDYVKEKYKKQGKLIIHFIPKELDFGEFLKTVKTE